MSNKYLFFLSQPYSFAILRPLQQAIRERGDEAAWYLDGPGEHYLRSDERRLHSIAEVKAYSPRAVFVPGNRVFDFFPGIKVEIFHGFNAQKREENRGHFHIRGFFDLYCTQGPSTTAPFRELEKKYRYFRVRETGWSKMDPLFNRPAPPREDPRPVILYTSTFTPRLSSAAVLFETIRALAAQERWRWLVTFHPRLDAGIIAQYKQINLPNLQFIETDDIIPLYQQADVMVSDTSSVISEFLLQHKPVVTFCNRRPGAHLLDVREPAALAAAIETALTRPTALIDNIRSFADSIHPYRDGRSSQRVLAAVDEFIANDLGRMPRKPLNLWRKFKLRKRVGYYHWS